MRPDRQFDQKAGMWTWTGVPIHGPVGRIAHRRSSQRRLVPWAATGFSLLWGSVFGLAIARDDLTLAIFSGLGMVLTLALNYSARSEIVDAFRSLADAAARNGGLDHMQVDEETIGRHLYTKHLPDPDLVVRTSGEMRVSNFLLWQIAYAEMFVTETLWPDFNRARLLDPVTGRQLLDDRLVSGNFAVQHAQRIGLEASL